MEGGGLPSDGQRLKLLCIFNIELFNLTPEMH